jgi:hypothetical protein
MDKLNISDIIKICIEVIPKPKRFSKLDEQQFHELWKATTLHVRNQVHQRKSIHFAGIGIFNVRVTKPQLRDQVPEYLSFFTPSKTFNKLPDFKYPKKQYDGTIPAEQLNPTGIAVLCSLTRDEVEEGLKDLGVALFRAIKRGSTLILSFDGVGKLSLSSTEAHYKLSPDLASALQVPKPIAGPNCSPPPISLPKINVTDGKLTCLTGSSGSSAGDQSTLTSNNDSGYADENDLMAIDPSEFSGFPSMVNLSGKSIPHTQEAHVFFNDSISLTSTPRTFKNVSTADKRKEDIDKAKLAIESLEETIKRLEKEQVTESTDYLAVMHDEKMKNSHRHPYSGDRLWKNDSCPICRQTRAPELETRTLTVMKEKQEDQLFLKLAKEMDTDFIEATKQKQREKMRIAIENAKYNLSVANEKTSTPNSLSSSLSDKKEGAFLFENAVSNHPFSNDDVKKYIKGLREQITDKQTQRVQEKLAQEYEDRVIRRKFLKEFKTAELEEQLTKMKKRQTQQQDLVDQIRLHKVIDSVVAKQSEVPFENTFASDETEKIKTSRAKAKEVYNEQIQMMNKRKENEAKLNEMEKANSIERLILSRKQFEEDVRRIRLEKIQKRKNLESYWNKQVTLKKETVTTDN